MSGATAHSGKTTRRQGARICRITLPGNMLACMDRIIRGYEFGNSAARMVSSDFANIGASREWRMYVHTVPFMNAAIQGFDQLYQICRPEYRNDLKEPKWGTDRRQHVRRTLRAGACLAGMAFGVWLLINPSRCLSALPSSHCRPVRAAAVRRDFV